MLSFAHCILMKENSVLVLKIKSNISVVDGVNILIINRVMLKDPLN